MEVGGQVPGCANRGLTQGVEKFISLLRSYFYEDYVIHTARSEVDSQSRDL